MYNSVQIQIIHRRVAEIVEKSKAYEQIQPGISGAGYATCIVESLQILCGLCASAVRHAFSGLG
jgi:hypothetical protein